MKDIIVALISSASTLIAAWWAHKKFNKTAGAKLVETIDQANLLYPLLWEVLTQFHAKRICIFEFHNGGKYYSGKSIQRVTMSYEVAAYELRRISREFQGTVMSDAFHIGIKELIETGLVYYPNVDILPEMGTKSMLQYYGSKGIVGVLYKNKQGDPIACLTVCFDSVNPLTIPELEILKTRSGDIEKLFMA